MKNSEESAFGYGFANEQSHQEVPGLTKREYFAGLAMQGLISNSGQVQIYAGNNPEPVPIYVAKTAIGLADELLRQLEYSKP